MDHCQDPSREYSKQNMKNALFKSFGYCAWKKGCKQEHLLKYLTLTLKQTAVKCKQTAVKRKQTAVKRK